MSGGTEEEGGAGMRLASSPEAPLCRLACRRHRQTHRTLQTGPHLGAAASQVPSPAVPLAGCHFATLWLCSLICEGMSCACLPSSGEEEPRACTGGAAQTWRLTANVSCPRPPGVGQLPFPRRVLRTGRVIVESNPVEKLVMTNPYPLVVGPKGKWSLSPQEQGKPQGTGSLMSSCWPAGQLSLGLQTPNSRVSHLLCKFPAPKQPVTLR